jgi:predicted Zn finger-like uncharacterized protein
MIVKCEQCQTRFKIPDEKVTDKGVKVRCTKCGHTFRVTRESAASPSGTSTPAVPPPGAAPADAGFDPFEKFGAAPEPPKGHSTRPGFYAEGVEATRSPAPPPAPPPAPWNAPDSGMEEDFFQETTRVMPLTVPPEARPPTVPEFTPAPPTGLRQNTPAPGQGLPGPGGAPFKPSGPGLAPLPGVPSVAPSVAPLGARGLPPAPPVKPATPGLPRPLGGAAPPAAPRTLAPPAMPIPGPSASTNSGRAALKPLAPPLPPPPAAPAGAADLFTEFFNPGAAAPAGPLPELPPPGVPDLPPVAAAPAPAPAWPAPASSSFASPDDDPFGAVSGDLGGPPSDTGPAPEFDPTAMFDAPPSPAPMGRATPAPLPPPMPAAPASFGDDPFGSSNADFSEPAADEFGFGGPPAPAPAPVPSPAPMSFADEDPFGPMGGQVGGAPEMGAALAPDPFAPSEPMQAAPPADEFGPSFGGGDMSQAPAAPGGMSADFAPPGPMDFGTVGDEQMPSGGDPFAPPAPAGGMGDPFAAPDPFAPPAGNAADPFAAQDPFAPPAPAGGMADPFAALAPGGDLADPFAAQDPFAAPAPGGGMADPFAAPPGGDGHSDPFAAAEPAFSPTATGRQRIGASEDFLTQTDTSHQVIGPSDTGRQLLDIPAHSEAEPSMGEEPAAGTRELIDLPSQPAAESAPPPRPVPTLASPAIARPAGRPADMGIPEKRKLTTAQAVTGQVAYLTIAAGLLLALTAVGGVYMKKGRVDPSALSPGEILKLLTPSQFSARDVSNGLYDTRGGGSLFYVRGEVENRSSKPAKVKVQAALYDGDQRVQSAEGLAGKVPSPEELHASNSAEATAQLRTQLDGGAQVIAPGQRAPFTLLFQDLPQDLSAFRLQLTMEPVGGEGSQP